MITAVQAGLLRSMLVSRDKVIDLVPVDVVINTMIVAAWKRGMESKSLNMPIIPIYNCTSGATNPITWGEILDKGLISARKNPVETIFW